jgi:hypothetical protein
MGKYHEQAYMKVEAAAMTMCCAAVHYMCGTTALQQRCAVKDFEGFNCWGDSHLEGQGSKSKAMETASQP